MVLNARQYTVYVVQYNSTEGLNFVMRFSDGWGIERRTRRAERVVVLRK